MNIDCPTAIASGTIRAKSAFGSNENFRHGAPYGNRTRVSALRGRTRIRDTFDDDLIIVTPKLSRRSQELLNTMASRIFGCGGFVWAQNEARTPCYHFATQLGSTGRYGSEQGKAFERNPLDNSVLTGTQQNTK
jgi:hypothetical protein